MHVCDICNPQTVETDEVIEEETPDSPGIEKQDKEKDHKDPRKLRCKLFFLYLVNCLSILFAFQRFLKSM